MKKAVMKNRIEPRANKVGQGYHQPGDQNHPEDEVLKFKNWAAIKKDIKDNLKEGDNTNDYIKFLKQRRSKIRKKEQLVPLVLDQEDNEYIISFDSQDTYLVVLSTKTNSDGDFDPSGNRRVDIYNSYEHENTLTVVLPETEFNPKIRFVKSPWGASNLETGTQLHFYVFDGSSFLILTYYSKFKSINCTRMETKLTGLDIGNAEQCIASGFTFPRRDDLKKSKFFAFNFLSGSVGVSCVNKKGNGEKYEETSYVVRKISSKSVTKAIGDNHYPLVYAAIESKIKVFKVGMEASGNLSLTKLQQWTAHTSAVKDLVKFNDNHLISAAEGGALRIWVIDYNGSQFKRTSRKESQRLLCFQKAFIDSIVHNSNYLVGLSAFGEVKAFSQQYNFEEKCLHFSHFETKHQAEGGEEKIEEVAIDSQNNIYALSKGRIKIWHKSYLFKERNFENVLTEPDHVNGQDNPTDASIRRLEYASAGNNCMLLCYSELYSGNGRLSIWRPDQESLEAIEASDGQKESRLLKDHMKDTNNEGFNKLESKIDISKGMGLNKLQWKFNTKFEENINMYGFAWSNNLKYLYLFDQTELEIRGYSLDPKGIKIEPTQLHRIRTKTLIQGLAINESGSNLVATTRSRAFFWDFEAPKRSSKEEDSKRRQQLPPIASPSNRQRSVREEVNPPSVIEDFNRIKRGGVHFLSHSEDTVSILEGDKTSVFRIVPKKNKVLSTRLAYTRDHFEDWEQGDEQLLHFSSNANIVVSGILEKYPRERIIVRKLRQPRYSASKIGKNPVKFDKAAERLRRIAEENRQKKQEEEEYEVIQTLKFEDTKSHMVSYFFKEVSGQLFLIAYFKGKGFSPYTEVYSLNRMAESSQFIFVRKLESDSGVCFNPQFSFIAFGSNLGKAQILIKKNSYEKGELPECFKLYDHLLWVFQGVKNTINPQHFLALADYLKKNELVFNDLIIHKEINMLFLAVISGSPECLKTCLNNFGYNLYFYGSSKMDPLLKAIEMRDEGLLDTFSDYFEDHVLQEFNEKLFFRILKSQSIKLKHMAVKQFLTHQGDEKNVFISSTYPLRGNYEIIPFQTNTRGMSFKKELQRRANRRRYTKQISVEYFVSVFKVNFKLRSEFGTNFIESMIKVEDEIMMTNLKYLILEMWETNYPLVFVYSILNLGAVLLFFFWVSIYREQDWMIYVLVPAFFLFLATELLVMYGNFIRYWTQKTNWVDMAEYIAIPVFILFDRYGPNEPEYKDTNIYYNGFIITLMFLAFMRSLTMLRFWERTRYLVNMIFTTFSDIKSFLTILVMTVVCFGLMHAQAFKTETTLVGGIETYRETMGFREVLDLMFNFAFGNWGDSSTYNFPQYYSFLIFVVFLPLVMMNLFIAIIWDTYANVRDGKTEADLNEMLDIMGDFNYLLKYLGLFARGDSQKYIHMIKKRGDDGGSEEATKGSGLDGQLVMQRLDLVLKGIEDSDERLDEKVDKLEDRLARIEKLITKGHKAGLNLSKTRSSQISDEGEGDYD